MATDPPIPPPEPNPTPARDPGHANLPGGPAPNPQPGRGGGEGAGDDIRALFESINVSQGYVEQMLARLEAGKALPFQDRPGSLEGKIADAFAKGMVKSTADVARVLAAHFGTTPAGAPATPPALPPPVGLPPGIPSWDAYRRFEAQRAARMPEAQARSAAQRLTEEAQAHEKGLRAEALNRALYGAPPGLPLPAPTTQRVLPATPPAGMPPPPPAPPARDFAGAPAVVTHSPAEDLAHAQAQAAWEQARQAKIAAENAARAQAPFAAPAQAAPPPPVLGRLPRLFGALGDAVTGAVAGFGKLNPVLAVAGGAVYSLHRLVAAGNPVAAATFSQSVELIKARVGRDLAPVLDDFSTRAQSVADAYSSVPRDVRGGALRAGLKVFDPFSAFDYFSKAFGGVGGADKAPPLRSYKGLPPVETLSGEDFSARLGGAGLAMGPLDVKVWAEKQAAILESLGGKLDKIADNTANPGGFNFGR